MVSQTKKSYSFHKCLFLSFFFSETNVDNYSKPGPSCSVLNKEIIIRKLPHTIVSKDSDDYIADPSYEINGNLSRHVVADDDLNSDNSSEASIKENENPGRPKRGRKRKYIEQNRALKKINKNSNKTYFNYKGRKIDPKPFNDYFC